MKLSPTQIFEGKKIFFIGGRARSADTLVRMIAKQSEEAREENSINKLFAGGIGDADKSVRAPT
jgi:hypothetical protein